ncbi:MAG: precorrin-8X methylmutase [Nitrospirae bacterium]|nr:precorrin-8X methylmutase [Nitrospirota bacterium]MBF0592561.1 precorrin-8X methylmutase [Nitrospirota bacterium]
MSKGAQIEQESFDIIRAGLRRSFSEAELAIVQRVIHASGDFSFEDNIRFHPRAIEAGIEAIREGKDILVDVHMVQAGINKRLLEHFGGEVLCYISEPDVAVEASRLSLTRSECAIMRAFSVAANIGIVAIGNAPTALLKLLEIVSDVSTFFTAGGRTSPPDLIVGIPVGFVKAEESKDLLLASRYPFITSVGKKGGSSIAAATVNALLKLSAEE